jgi:alkylated DNA nucleotide flippase Atl1
VTTIDDYSSRVLDVVDAIPPGQVMSYGDIAEYLGAGGPRQVGQVLARYGGGAPWWRVTHADGTPAPGHEAQALARYLAEGTPLLSPRGTPPRTPLSPGGTTTPRTPLLSPGGTTPRTPRLSRPDGLDGKNRHCVEPVPTGREPDEHRDPVRVRVNMRQARWKGAAP